MRFSDYVRLAYKNLTRQKTRTALTIVAITVGSLSLILMVSIILSIRESLVNQFKQLGAFDLVTVIKDPNSTDNNTLIGSNGDPSEGKKIDDTTLANMKTLPHVAAATPTASLWVNTIRLEGNPKKTWANIVAYDPANDVFGMSIVAGRKLNSTDMDKIVVGSRFMQDIGFAGQPKDLIGKKVILISKMGGGGNGIDWGPLPEKPPVNADKSWYENQSKNGIEIPAEIVGITANGSIDSGGSYVTLGWARRLMTMVSWQWPEMKEKDNYQMEMTLVKDDQLTKNGYSSIILKSDDQKNLDVIASGVKAQGYGATTAKTMLDQINKILATVGAVLAVIGGISLFVAAIGIINTMIMATYERTREIGVMRACGATKSTIQKLFTFEAAMLGFWGGLFGMLVSLGIGGLVRFLMLKKGLTLGDLPVTEIGKFPWWLIVSVLAFTTLVGMLSGLYPAHRASKMNPVDALRYE